MLIRKDINNLIHEAESGDVASQIYLGYHYLYGFNVQRNLDKSYEIFRNLAEQGYTYAQDALDNCFSAPGVLGEEFKGIYSDLREIIAVWDQDEIHESKHAVQTLRLLNHPRYNRLLADCFLDGYGLPKNERQGFALYEYMQEKLDWVEVRYACCLLYGIGTEQDPNKGYYWLNKIHEDDYSNGEASYYLALCYINEWGCEVDLAKALSLFKQSANHGFKKAYYDIGVMYRFGEGVEIDMEKAIFYYQKGLNAGVSLCAVNLGVVYEKGINGVPVDMKKAQKYYLAGIELGNPDCMFNLGGLYYNGFLDNGKRDFKNAIRYFEMAAELGEPDSMYHLGLCYLEGNGVEENQQEAVNLFIAAARKGLDAAIKILEENNINWNEED